jgi:hypothetical protein
MRWLKRKLVQKAYNAVGLLSAEQELTPEEEDDGLDSLNAMMVQWDSEGVRLGYNPNGDLDSDPGIDPRAYRAVYLNLALELGASLGREIPPVVTIGATSGLSRLKSLVGKPIPMKLPSTTPLGAGHKGWREAGRVFANEEDDALNTDTDSELEFK